MKRRDFLKTGGALAAGAVIAPSALAAPAGAPTASDGASMDGAPAPEKAPAPQPGIESLNDLEVPVRGLRPMVRKQVTAIMIGSGARGNTYAKCAEMFPEALKFVGVSDINDYRRDEFARDYGIAEDRKYGDFSEILSVPKFADCAIICTPDDLHYAPAMMALKLGYHVLVEKPIAPTEKECRGILALSLKTGLVVGTCHVLRYAPYFMTLREVLRKGMIGEVVSIQHQEPIQYQHMAHSYVRGNWRDSAQTTPIILAKSCHDLDILRWLIGRPCETISADGSLYLFKAANAPEGAPARCTDGCPHEPTCPYSAINIYVRQKKHTYVFDIPDRNDEAALLEEIRKGPYGRCVFHCDNNQPDHYVAGMVFEGGVTASFSMDAFTPRGGRRTKVMGTTGYIEGDGHTFTLNDFRTGKQYLWDRDVSDIPEYKDSGHGGGDLALFRDFIEAVSYEDPGRLSSTIDVSMESHLMGFAAEKSRRSRKKVKVRLG